MDDFKKKYCRAGKAVLGPYGFRCTKKGIFIRMVNDVVQSVSVDAPPSGPFKKWRRIGFGVVPLCERPELEDVLSGRCGPCEYLRRFEYGGPGSSDDGWEFEPSPEATDACVKDIMRYITTYLIPFFEKADWSSALVPTFAELRERFERTRQELLRAEGLDAPTLREREQALLSGSVRQMMDRIEKDTKAAWGSPPSRAEEVQGQKGHPGGLFLALKEKDYDGAAACAERSFGEAILWYGDYAKLICRLHPAMFIPVYEHLLARLSAHRRKWGPLPAKQQALWDKMEENLEAAVHFLQKEEVYSRREQQMLEGIRLSILDRADKLIEKESFVRRFWDKDWDYFRTLIRENEAYSREQFKDFIWTHPGD